MSEKFVRICPKCKSTDVVKDLSTQSYAQGSFFNEFKCNNCGFTGQLFPEIPENELKVLKKKK